MSWKKVSMSEFLKHRDIRFKPNDTQIQKLKRIEKIDFSGKIFISNKPSNTDMILVKRGDLVISGINVEKGAMAVYQGEEDLAATVHYSSYEFDRSKIEEEFLKSFIKSEEFIKAIKEQVPGGIKTEIKPRHLLPLIINMPSDINEQRRIISKLQSKNGKLEEIAHQHNHQLELLIKLRQQILQDAVQGKLVPQDPNDESARMLLEKIKAEKEELSRKKKTKKEKPLSPIKVEEIPFDIPENWVWCRLGEVAELNGRIGWKGLSASEYTEKGALFLSVHSLNHGDYVDYNKAYHISIERYDESPEIMLQNNDVLICKDGAGIGKLGIVKNLQEKATVNSSLLVIRSNKRLNVKYIYHYLLSKNFQNLVNARIMGATTPHLYQRDLVNFLLAIPPIDVQNKLAMKTERLLTLCDELEQTSKRNQKHTEELLQVALREALKAKNN